MTFRQSVQEAPHEWLREAGGKLCDRFFLRKVNLLQQAFRLYVDDNSVGHLGQDILAEDPLHLRQGSLSSVLQFESAMRQPLLVDRFEAVFLCQAHGLLLALATQPGIDAFAEQGASLVA
ncbi:hypothetical protein [Candidimonas humi]|uniref:hypothetical protein n=1 Tax=Candidimonas humi TaxID=683355 RepID=UPI003CCEDBC5